MPVLAKCSVLVVGGGPSGLSAAISAARAGADTMICERFGCFGGVITTVGMETLAWYRYEGCVNDTEVILSQIWEPLCLKACLNYLAFLLYLNH